MIHVQENIRLTVRISGTAVTEDQIRELLAFVGLTMKEMMMILNIEALYEIRTIILFGIFTVLLLSFAVNMLANFSLVALNPSLSGDIRFHHHYSDLGVGCHCQ